MPCCCQEEVEARPAEQPIGELFELFLRDADLAYTPEDERRVKEAISELQAKHGWQDGN
jgi:hypothetical protein